MGSLSTIMEEDILKYGIWLCECCSDNLKPLCLVLIFRVSFSHRFDTLRNSSGSSTEVVE